MWVRKLWIGVICLRSSVPKVSCDSEAEARRLPTSASVADGGHEAAIFSSTSRALAMRDDLAATLPSIRALLGKARIGTPCCRELAGRMDPGVEAESPSFEVTAHSPTRGTVVGRHRDKGLTLASLLSLLSRCRRWLVSRAFLS